MVRMAVKKAVLICVAIANTVLRVIVSPVLEDPRSEDSRFRPNLAPVGQGFAQLGKRFCLPLAQVPAVTDIDQPRSSIPILDHTPGVIWQPPRRAMTSPTSPWPRTASAGSSGQIGRCPCC